jgi:hypothetical protein
MIFRFADCGRHHILLDSEPAWDRFLEAVLAS